MLTLRWRVVLLGAVALVVAGSAAVVAALLREAQWRTQMDRAARLPLQQAWAGAAEQARERLARPLDRLQRDGALPPPAEAASAAARLAEAARQAELLQIDLYDRQRHLQASSAGPAAQPLVDAGSLLLLGLAGAATGQHAGVRLRTPSDNPALDGSPALYVLVRRLADGSVLAAALDLRPVLQAAERPLGQDLALSSPRGLLLAGVPPPPAQRLTLPLPGLAPGDTRPAALLQAARPAVAAAPALGVAPLAWLAAVPLVVALSLAFALRRLMAPLLAPVRQVEALAEGRLQAGADDADTPASAHAVGEAARLARAAERLRTELRTLDALRDERQRVAAQQARLLRGQLRALADMLDPEGRREILAELDDEGTGDGRPQLARLATLLGRLTTLVGRQQGRLLQLLRELQDSVRTRELFASLQQELEIARRLQQAILPRAAPPLRELRLQATMIPAREVGGDFYDWFMLDDRRLALVVADVSGKGVPAAFFMAVTRTLLRSTAAFVGDPAAVLARLNDELAADNDEALFVTLFYAVLDLRSGRLDSVNAGHNPPLLRRADGRVQALPRGRNPVLAAFPGLRFEADTLQLAPGDGLLLYTDGLTEAQDAAGALFGEAALASALATAGEQPVQALVAAVRAFEDGAAQADDLTCVWLHWRPGAPGTAGALQARLL